MFTETKYDNLGRVAANANPYRLSDAEIYWSKPRYDELNRVVETYAPAVGNSLDINVHGASLGITEFGISTVQDFVGTYTTATDASGRRARSITNALGQLIRIDEPTGINNDLGLIGSPNQPTFYKYNSQGKMVKVSQGQQNRYFLYDYLGRLIRVKQPEQEVNSALDLTDTVTNNNQWTAGFEYDIVGSLKKTTDAKGSIITNSYDKAGRVTERTYNDPNTPSVNYYYDGTGLGAVPQYSKGKLTKVMSSISTTQYTSFDNFGRNLVSQQITDGQTYESKYKYDFGGRMVEQTYPSGKVVRNFFENDGDLAKVVRNGKTYVSDFSYNASGGINSLKLGNGRWETAEFNSRQQLTQLGLGANANESSLFKLQYEFGELTANGTIQNTGNITKQTITLPNASFVQTYKYDALDRIVEAKENNGTATGTQNWKQTYNYDRFGNRLNFSSLENGKTAITTTPQIDPLTNRFNLGQGFEYDKAGNIKKDNSTEQVREFVFNGDNKQVHVKDASGNPIGTYYYDGNGARVKKTTATETTIFVYDGSGKLVAEYSTATPTANPTVSYTATDPLGSPRVITDKNGNVTSRRDFMPFGEEVYTPQRNQSLKYQSDSVKQKYNGKERDGETEQDFFGARYYSPIQGRFTTTDPISLTEKRLVDPQQLNLYAYVRNNPLILVDPTGEDVYFKLSKEPVGKTTIRLVQPDKKQSSNIPDTVEVDVYKLEVWDDATKKTSTYFVTRDGPALSDFVKGSSPIRTPSILVPGVVTIPGVAITSGSPDSITVNNYAFEPKGEDGNYIVNRIADYNGTGPGYVLTTDGKNQDLPAEKNGSPFRKKGPEIASDILVHVGGTYYNSKSKSTRITGSEGCITLCMQFSGNAGLAIFDKDVQARVEANRKAKTGTTIRMFYPRRTNVTWNWRLNLPRVQ